MKNNYMYWSPLCLRLIVGFGFMAHGWAKISRGTAGFEKLLIQTGVPMPHLMSIVAPYTELIGGFLILIGLFTRWVSIPLIISMLVAMLTVNIHYGFSSIKTIGLTPAGPLFGPPGYEINLLYIACLLSLMITGAGALSVDLLMVNTKTRVEL
ncbi:DoxX family protein [Mucilaginibacter pocheonensis]|uniref:Oxidoreductase n=1 Tax=Mucilaginibacter pocheonensis TaxID=398050 RepID=A0ABU1TCN1_9SPHI|nr:DoxX family protein [Mucilaginibacter pocheonensis]MDR6943158.1 putative oxidoreductase [Mucilaginibacter pocheonensis]